MEYVKSKPTIERFISDNDHNNINNNKQISLIEDRDNTSIDRNKKEYNLYNRVSNDMNKNHNNHNYRNEETDKKEDHNNLNNHDNINYNELQQYYEPTYNNTENNNNYNQEIKSNSSSDDNSNTNNKLKKKSVNLNTNINYSDSKQIYLLTQKISDLETYYSVKIKQLKYDDKLNLDIIDSLNHKIKEYEQSKLKFHEDNTYLSNLNDELTIQNQQLQNKLVELSKLIEEKDNQILYLEDKIIMRINNNTNNSNTNTNTNTNDNARAQQHVTNKYLRLQSKCKELIKEKKFNKEYINELSKKIDSFEVEYNDLVQKLKMENQLLSEKMIKEKKEVRAYQFIINNYIHYIYYYYFFLIL